MKTLKHSKNEEYIKIWKKIRHAQGWENECFENSCHTETDVQVHHNPKHSLYDMAQGTRESNPKIHFNEQKVSE